MSASPGRHRPPATLSSARVSPERLSDEVARKLLERIRDETFRPGTKLPSGRALASTFGISQATLREALRTLETMGAVVIQHGRGVFVRPGGSLNGVWSTRWMAWTLQHASSLIELLEVQEAVEAKAAWLAAINGTRQDHARLDAILREAQALVQAGGRRGADGEVLASYVRLDYALHHALADAARNAFLRSLVEGLGSALRGSREATLAIPGRIRRSLREHRRIVAAVKRGNAEAARTAMQAHVRRVLEEVRSAARLSARSR